MNTPSRLLLGLALALSITGCKKRLDTEKGEKVILEGLKAQGGDVKSLSCPKEIELKVGLTFDCTGKMGDGKDLTVAVTITDDSGNVTYKVTKVGDQTAPAKDEPKKDEPKKDEHHEGSAEEHKE